MPSGLNRTTSCAKPSTIHLIRTFLTPQPIYVRTLSVYLPVLVFVSRSYLALVAALASEADFVFIPEDPAVANWPEKLCKKLEQVHFQNNRFPLDLVLNILLWVFNGDRFLDFDFYQAR